VRWGFTTVYLIGGLTCEIRFVILCWRCLLLVGDVFLLGKAFAGVFGSIFSGSCFHLLVVSTHITRRSFLCRAGAECFSLRIAGWTVVGGFE